MVAANAAPHKSTWPSARKGSTGMHGRFAVATDVKCHLVPRHTRDRARSCAAIPLCFARL